MSGFPRLLSVPPSPIWEIQVFEAPNPGFVSTNSKAALFTISNSAQRLKCDRILFLFCQPMSGRSEFLVQSSLRATLP